jgi:intracellular sulfur oxidation DsrE/DsrF family protein
MKRFLLLVVLLICAVQLLTAQTQPYKVVFDLTSRDTVNQQTVIRWVNEVVKANANAQVEVVMFGQGLNLAIKDRSVVADEVTRLAENKNVAFRVCAVAMKNQNVDKSQLLPGVETVPDGIYEIISKQGEGWGYIKVAH